jgi:2-phospho-L-lactate transferase/gluconeogenesis factor (CofD/UPF0052 family)
MGQLASISGQERWARLWRWLQPGLGIKRWIIVYLFSLTLIALGLGLILTHLYRTAPFPSPVYYLTLQFIPRLERGLLLFGAGAALMVLSTVHLLATFLGLLVPHYRGRVGEALYEQRVLRRGIKVVAIGGGTGLSTLLRGMKEHTSNITAVVTVCDDGGSSGRLRRDLRLLPPGDFRQCIAALADADPLVTRLFEHRFQAAGSDLKGHSFGNLFIAALAQITGSFEHALEESSRVLAVRGRILPSTLEDVTLCAELADQSVVHGESLIPAVVSGQSHQGQSGHQTAGHNATAEHDAGAAPRPAQSSLPAFGAPAPPQTIEAGTNGAAGEAGPLRCEDGSPAEMTDGGNPIQRVFLRPEHPAVYPEVVRSLLDADLIVIGPGSLYTSILPNLLVDDLARALCWSRAVKIYVCNVATQPGETDGYDVVDHVRAIHQHLEERLAVPVGRTEGNRAALVPFTHVLVNSNLQPEIPSEWGVTRPSDGAAALAPLGIQVIEADVVDESRPTRHDPAKLARALMQAYAELRAAQSPSPLRWITCWARSVRPPARGPAPALQPAHTAVTSITR